MATQQPESSPQPDRPRQGLLRRMLWQSDDKYFYLPETPSETPDPPYEGPFGSGLKTFARKFWDWTGGDHPRPLFYVAVGIILGGITLLEYWLFTTDLEKKWINSALFALSSAKFFMVVAFFMHLKFDNKWFAKLFGAGFFAAMAIFLAILALNDKLNG